MEQKYGSRILFYVGNISEKRLVVLESQENFNPPQNHKKLSNRKQEDMTLKHTEFKQDLININSTAA